jgi:ribosomal subunit interface protein
MDVKIHGNDIKVSDELDDYTRAKIDKLDRYLPNISHVGVELSIKKTHRGADLAIAQITVHHSRGAILRAEEKL